MSMTAKKRKDSKESQKRLAWRQSQECHRQGGTSASRGCPGQRAEGGGPFQGGLESMELTVPTKWAKAIAGWCLAFRKREGQVDLKIQGSRLRSLQRQILKYLMVTGFKL